MLQIAFDLKKYTRQINVLLLAIYEGIDGTSRVATIKWQVDLQ